MNDTRTSPFLSVGKVARMCGVSNRTVLNWIAQGRIEAHALPSGHFPVHVDEVRTFMQSNEMELPAKISDAAALRDTLCWSRRDLTEGMPASAAWCWPPSRCTASSPVACWAMAPWAALSPAPPAATSRRSSGRWGPASNWTRRPAR